MNEENTLSKLSVMVMILISGLFACNLFSKGETNRNETLGTPVVEDYQTEKVIPSDLNLTNRIQPEDLTYMGAFRLPEDQGWDYSGHGMTHYPDGNPLGTEDGFPGSLFIVGHDHHQYVSEINIPVPVISKELIDLNIADTLQPFSDLTGGIFSAEEMSIPRSGIAFLEQQGEQSTPKIHFAWGQHFQEFEPSHGWAELDLTKPNSAGPWIFDGYTNYVTNDYLFDIPTSWADTYAPGMFLATGRAREGIWSGRGPALFAYSPWSDGNPPAENSILTSIKPLLLYGIPDPDLPEIQGDETMAMEGYRDADHWTGGSWLTAGDTSAVIFIGTKASGNEWYGFANGAIWPHDCAEQNNCPEPPEWPYDNRGFWAEDYEAQIIFFDPTELGAVALGQLETWVPQPYGTLVIDDYLLEPELDVSEYKRDFVAAAAFDRISGFLYVIERLADKYRSVVHVWKVE